MKSLPLNVIPLISRRRLLKHIGFAPLVFRAAPLFGTSGVFSSKESPANPHTNFPFADDRLSPHYPVQSALADILKLVAPGSDQFVTEKYAVEIESVLAKWMDGLKASPHEHAALSDISDESIQVASFSKFTETKERSSFGIDVSKRLFGAALVTGRKNLLNEMDAWLGPVKCVMTAEFEIFGIEVAANAPLTVHIEVRYDLVAQRSDDSREERVGSW